MWMLFSLVEHNTGKGRGVVYGHTVEWELLHFAAAERGSARLTANILRRLRTYIAQLRLGVRGGGAGVSRPGTLPPLCSIRIPCMPAA